METFTLYDNLRQLLLDPDKGLDVNENNIYSNFPIYKELDDKVLIAPMVVLSPSYGILIFEASSDTDTDTFNISFNSIKNRLDNLYTQILTRLLRNPILKSGRTSVTVKILTMVYAPLTGDVSNYKVIDDILVFYSDGQLLKYLRNNKSRISSDIFNETVSTIEGAKGIIAPILRETTGKDTRGAIANNVDGEIAMFDQRQKALFLQPITGLSRIRGLAGSGKTIILCMKAALLHLQYPESIILYTFYTKSLYQHVRRLITRFYRQFADQDPNWDKMIVRHAWGNYSAEGVYREACDSNNIFPLSFEEAKKRNYSMPFDAACQDFINRVPSPSKEYDYILIDEGQDFPKSFIQMCHKLVKEEKLIYAYDDLQTIFQSEIASATDIFGKKEDGTPRSFAQDIILYKCYRNPREIILVAHAIGFGIYSKIVQMIEKESSWKDIGYEVKEGKLESGSNVKILRPEENSLKSVSDAYSIDEIIRGEVFDDFKEETSSVVKGIEKDIKTEHLKPEDILVITVDDRYALQYLSAISSQLSVLGIECNNVHADKYSVKDFHIKGQVTLSTIHKAKGNEAFSVYIVGIDALKRSNSNVRERNLLFTAMTRSKGWVKLSGMGDVAQNWINEINTAKSNFPFLSFVYPDSEHLRTMKLDLMEAGQETDNDYRMLDKILEKMSQEQINDYINQKKLNKIF